MINESEFSRAAPGRRIQFAALPIRMAEAAGPEILLITSRDTGRWVIPKGWPIPGLSGAATAAVEAYEEAGIEGHVHDTPLGTYRYDKRTRRRLIPCEVTVFPMRVDVERDDWPERAERRTLWVEGDEAADLVDEPGLAALMRMAPRGFEDAM